MAEKANFDGAGKLGFFRIGAKLKNWCKVVKSELKPFQKLGVKVEKWAKKAKNRMRVRCWLVYKCSEKKRLKKND